MYIVKYLSDKEYDALPIKHAKTSLGAADPKIKTAWVRRSNVPIRDAFVAEHELEELIQKVSPDEIDGIRYKGSKSVLGQVGDWLEKTFIPEGAKEFVTDKVPWVGDMLSRGWLGPVAQQFTQEGKEAYEKGTGTSGIMNNWVNPMLMGAIGGPLAAGAFGALNSPTGFGNMALGGVKGYGLGKLGQWGSQSISNMFNSAGAGPTAATGPGNVLGSQTSRIPQTPGITNVSKTMQEFPMINSAVNKGFGFTGLNNPLASANMPGVNSGVTPTSTNWWQDLLGGKNWGTTALGLGIGGLGQLMNKQPQIPNFNELGGVQGFKNMLSQGPTAVQITPETRLRLEEQVNDQYDQALKELNARYKNLRPGADYASDSDYKGDLDRLNEAKADAIKGMVDEYQNRVYSDQLQGAQYFADMDQYQLMAQTGLDQQQAQEFQNWLRSLGGAFMQSGLGIGG